GMKTQYIDLLIEKKRMIVGKLMAGDIDNLAHFIKKISAKKTYGTDLTLYGLKRALVEVMACFPVYRSYVNSAFIGAIDRFYIDIALHRAKERLPDFIYELEFIESIFSGIDSCSEEEKSEMLDFIMRFQQYTGPLMAKGFEDTTLYIYNRMISLNEVGGMPDQFGFLPEEFHEYIQQRAKRWPHTMNATATHDTKRGEDVRARINVLSEMPEEWEKYLKLWSKLNRRKKRIVKNIAAPHRNDEYFLYQTLIGSFPLEEPCDLVSYQERIKKYIIKAVREAKVHTAWLKPDEDYEQAYLDFVEHLLQDSSKNLFLESLKTFLNKISFYGMLNGLSQTLLKLSCPGVPDFYQGTEFWDLHLVDPDNRMPVDYEKRKTILEKCALKDQDRNHLQSILEEWKDGVPKLYLIKRLLALRNQDPMLFQKGQYQPLYAQGRRKDHLVSFMLSHEERRALVVAPRFFSFLSEPEQFPFGKDVWEDTHFLLPETVGCVWHQALSNEDIHQEGQEIEVGDILFAFPCAVLTV
ncbi:MAG: malto-oligosyltrehalose synthase, partial [Chlamydiota bacterium]|nr:malto-oligosyltrehalose synthase [Chlamydiota bacterium]